MKKSILALVSILLLGAWLVSGCGQTSTSATSVDLFPTSTGVSLSKIESLGSASVSVNEVSVQGTYSTLVSAIGVVTGNLVDNDDSLFNSIFLMLNAFEEKLATNTVTKSFSATLGGSSKTVKIDFSDFDFDGNGSLEGSSGTASFTDSAGAAKPVTVRIWIDDQRALAGLLTNKNAGTMYIKPSTFTSDHAANLQFKAEYSQVDDKEITVEGLGTVSATGTSEITISLGKAYVHFEPSNSITTINVNYNLSVHPLGYNLLTSIAKFDTQYMKTTSSSSKDAESAVTVSNQGISLADGNSAAVTDSKYNISLELVDNTNAEANCQWPNGFPEDPTL